MSNRLKGFYTIMALTILTTLIYVQMGSLNRLESNHLATAAETGTETAEEQAHENPNMQKGFSPAGHPPNITQVANNSVIPNEFALSSLVSSRLARFWKSVCIRYNNRIRRFSMSLLWEICNAN